MLFLGAQRLLERRPPRVEARLGLGLEAQEGQGLRRRLLRAERRRIQRVQALEELDHARPGIAVRPAIHVPPPPDDVGPHGQLKALEQPVIPVATEDLA